MSGNRWRVKHERYLFYGESRSVWEIQHLGDGWWETVDYEMSWQAAQNEADRLARTITVTLPRLADHIELPYSDYYVHEAGSSVMLEDRFYDGDMTIIHMGDYERLALVLLAIYHLRREQK